MNNTPYVIQALNGQHIVVHTSSLPSSASAVQVAAPNGQQLQQLQVVPLSTLQGTGGNIQPMQLVQTPDGQTFLYQPAASAQHTIDQHQIIHQPTVLNLNGNIVQVASLGNAVQPQQIVNSPNVVMMVNGTNATAAAGGAAAGAEACGGGGGGGVGSGGGGGGGGSDEEPLLYVNARQYKRILKRRAARAKLHELGKIPKERPKYLHESRHRHAMNRIRGEGGRFHSGTRKNMENSEQHPDEKNLEDIKPDTVSITIIQDEEKEEKLSTQWRRLAPHQPLQST